MTAGAGHSVQALLSAGDPARPLLTYYDGPTGGRVELSYATTRNWVAKTANLLVDELGVEPGDVVDMQLPAHWQAAVIALAVQAVGAAPAAGGGARVAFWAERTPLPDAEEVVGLSLAPMGGALRGAYPGVLDYADVLAQPDAFPLLPGAPVSGPGIAARLLATTVAPVVAVLRGGGSLVLVGDGVDRPHVADVERCSASWGYDVPGLPRLD